ncbi:uncharacterized protein LOC106158073 [Lingula anatina]|uniref:Uncharacterized protein LOC106158073 n=1 Tax=Lingula anatina TaxID=7574 RepID=A0A1S3HTL7_LINAN|nr:uncharacterized protein LOC106158073 [Lingula anatina]XP_013389391.1 uncharacterized protein LOC106158073 [Lingula anatina]|eukprot:XP_013389382.1 uncharacterized protein LOC106158073 [Lingula anatina]
MAVDSSAVVQHAKVPDLREFGKGDCQPVSIPTGHRLIEVESFERNLDEIVTKSLPVLEVTHGVRKNDDVFAESNKPSMSNSLSSECAIEVNANTSLGNKNPEVTGKVEHPTSKTASSLVEVSEHYREASSITDSSSDQNENSVLITETQNELSSCNGTVQTRGANTDGYVKESVNKRDVCGKKEIIGGGGGDQSSSCGNYVHKNDVTHSNNQTLPSGHNDEERGARKQNGRHNDNGVMEHQTAHQKDIIDNTESTTDNAKKSFETDRREMSDDLSLTGMEHGQMKESNAIVNHCLTTQQDNSSKEHVETIGKLQRLTYRLQSKVLFLQSKIESDKKLKLEIGQLKHANKQWAEYNKTREEYVRDHLKQIHALEIQLAQEKTEKKELEKLYKDCKNLLQYQQHETEHYKEQVSLLQVQVRQFSEDFQEEKLEKEIARREVQRLLEEQSVHRSQAKPLNCAAENSPALGHGSDLLSLGSLTMDGNRDDDGIGDDGSDTYRNPVEESAQRQNRNRTDRGTRNNCADEEEACGVNNQSSDIRPEDNFSTSHDGRLRCPKCWREYDERRYLELLEHIDICCD